MPKDPSDHHEQKQEDRRYNGIFHDPECRITIHRMNNTLRILNLGPLLVVLICVARAAVLKSRSSLILASQNGLLNETLGAGVPDDFETIGHTSRGGQLNSHDFFGLAIQVASDLAARESNSLIPRQKWLESDIALGLSMYGTPRRTRATEARFVVWGIYKAAEVIAATSYRGTSLQLKWRGVGVGTLGFYKEPLILPGIAVANNETRSNASPLTLDSTITDLPTLTPSNATALTAAQLQIQISDVDPGRSIKDQMSPADVFMTMLLLLVEATKYSTNDPIMTGFVQAFKGGSVKATVTGPETPKPLSKPPFFLFPWLCQGLREATRTMINTPKLYAFKIKMLVDGIEIGNVEFAPQTHGRVAVAKG